MLENNVDEKYYLSKKMLTFFYENTKKQQEKGNGFKFNPTNGNCIAHSITTKAGGRMDDNFIIVEGKIPTWHQRGSVYNINGISPTICSTDYKTPKLIKNQQNIRKLTPKECWRLMGFNDEDFEKVECIMSNTQLYKQAGNSIVVNVLTEIFRNLNLK